MMEVVCNKAGSGGTDPGWECESLELKPFGRMVDERVKEGG